jgi:hypothetical protein
MIQNLADQLMGSMHGLLSLDDGEIFFINLGEILRKKSIENNRQ